MDAQKAHWEQIYLQADTRQLTWYQASDLTSVDIISKLMISPQTGVLDIGGGDSLFAYNLIMAGFSDVSVLDVSGTAIKKAKERVGDYASRIQWIEADINGFKPERSYGLWHDRAAFHFLQGDEIHKYVETAKTALGPGAYLLIATFSDKGPDTCSGLPVQRYSKAELCRLFESDFDLVQAAFEDHLTPGGQVQNFIYGLFRRRHAFAPVQHSQEPEAYYNRVILNGSDPMHCELGNFCCS